MSDPDSEHTSTSVPASLPAFWTTNFYKGGVLQGIGVGLLSAGVLTLPGVWSVSIFTAERAIVVGAVMIVLGGLKARTGR